MARNFDVFKVVEINNSTALRIGHVIAQQPLAKADIEASGKVVPVSKDGYLDNGFFLKLEQVDCRWKRNISCLFSIQRSTFRPS